MPSYNTKRLAPVNTARFPMPEIAVDGQTSTPTMLVLYTGKSNKAFQLALTKAAMADNAVRAKFPTPDQYMASEEKSARIMRELIAGLVCVGWENVYQVGDDGTPQLEPTPWSLGECAKLFGPDGVPDDMIARMLAFCADANQFRGTLNAEAVAKN